MDNHDIFHLNLYNDENLVFEVEIPEAIKNYEFNYGE
jgi:hypothetical protein